MGVWSRVFYNIGRLFAPRHEASATKRLQRATFSRSFDEERARTTSGARPRTAGVACKTVGVDAPEEVLEWTRARLGAVHASADLGPISPELALVDPELAERARMLLPGPIEQARRRRVVPVASSPPVSERPESTRAPARPQRRGRWRRTALLAGLVFVAGAASGGLIGRKHASVPRFEAGVRTVTTRTLSLPERKSSHRGVVAESSHAALPAPNVLGVTAAVGTRGVRLGWQRPADSDHVAVIRTRGAGRSNVIVFRGRGTSYRDVSAHSCTTYRYTIVNYDLRGHRSTGVPTSIVTQGCT